MIMPKIFKSAINGFWIWVKEDFKFWINSDDKSDDYRTEKNQQYTTNVVFL